MKAQLALNLPALTEHALNSTGLTITKDNLNKDPAVAKSATSRVVPSNKKFLEGVTAFLNYFYYYFYYIFIHLPFIKC